MKVLSEGIRDQFSVGPAAQGCFFGDNIVMALRGADDSRRRCPSQTEARHAGRVVKHRGQVVPSQIVVSHAFLDGTFRFAIWRWRLCARSCWHREASVRHVATLPRMYWTRLICKRDVGRCSCSHLEQHVDEDLCCVVVCGLRGVSVCAHQH